MYFPYSFKAKLALFFCLFLYSLYAFSVFHNINIFGGLPRIRKYYVSEVSASSNGYDGRIESIKDFTRANPRAKERKFKAKNRAQAESLGLLNMKKFESGNYKFKYFFFSGHINYIDESTGEIFEADPAFEKQADGTFVMSKANYKAIAPAFADETLSFILDSEPVTFVASGIFIGATTTPVLHVAGIHNNNIVTYPDAFGSGIDYVIQAESDELRKLVVFKVQPADISQDIRIEFKTSLKSKAILRGKNTKIGSTFFRQPTVWDSSGTVEPIDIELDNGIFVKIIPKSFFDRSGDQQQLVYPVTTDVTTSYYAGAGDGYVHYTTGFQNWATAHAETGDNNVTADYTSTTGIVGSITNSGGAKMQRAFFPADTSGIADNDEITDARIKIWFTATNDDDDDGSDWINVVQTTQTSNTTLTGEDFDQCGSISNPTEGSTRADITSITIGAYTTFTLDATGESWISKTGYTNLGLREGHDATNSEISSTSNGDKGTFSTSENTGTSQDPVLEVDTTAAVITSLTTQRTIFSTSTANIIVSSSLTGETAASSTLEYVLFFDKDADNAPDTDETYVTGDCAGSATWSSGLYTFIKSNFTIADGESPKTHSWECANTNFPENGLYTILLTWKDANGTIDTEGGTDFQSCDQPTDSSDWYDTTYANRTILSFRSATFSEALLEFPVLVKATSTNFGFDDPDTSAHDVIFIDGLDDGQTALKFEREFYDSTTTKEGYWWVRVPKIATSTDCDYVQMYYDKAGATDTSTSTGTWRQDYYEAVWHFGETATGTNDFQDGVSPTAGYAGTEDLNLESGTPTANQNADTTIQVDGAACSGGGATCRPLMQWDISSIAASCEVTSASITINVTNATGSRYAVFGVRRNWGETTATWNTYDGASNWTTAGVADTTNDRYSTDLMNGNADGGFGSASAGSVTHNFDSDGFSYIQDLIDGVTTNNGFVFYDEAGDTDSYQWSYRVVTPATNRPKLTIVCGTNDIYLDSTLNNHDETNSTIASRKEKSQSKFGYSPKFNGSTSVIGIPDSAGFDLTNYTITGWYNRAGTGDPGLFSKVQQLEPFIAKGYAEADTQVADIQFSVGYNRTGQATLAANWEDDRHAAGNDWSHLGGSTISNSVWKHFGVRLKNESILNIYKDGFVDNTTTYPINQGASTGGTMKLGIGTAYNTAGTSDGKWNGYLDEIRIYKVAISTTTASNDSAWLRAEWYSADNGYVEWGTEATTSAALSITASSSVAFTTVNYSFSVQSSTALNIGGVQVVGVGTWNLNLSCNDGSGECLWRGQSEADRFQMYRGIAHAADASSSGIFCRDGGGDDKSGYSCTSVSGDSCATVSLNDKFRCFNSAKADLTLVTGTSADGTFWFKEDDWYAGIPAGITASIYTTTLIFDLQ